MKRVDPEVLIALKEALVTIYWYKRDLNTFLRQTLTDKTLLGGVNWTSHQKREAVDIVVDRIAADPEEHNQDLLGLLVAVTDMTGFEHLKHLEDGEKKAKRADSSVADLRVKVGKVKGLFEEQAKSAIRREQQSAKAVQTSTFQANLTKQRTALGELISMPDTIARGYALERLLRDIFELFDLDPKASFKIVGEQIDGAFSFDGTDFLLEARWREKAADASALDVFAQKVQRKLDNTLGLFVSMGGYCHDGIIAHSQSRKVLVLLDGAHITAILEARLSFPELLLRARRHASQTGAIYLPLSEIF